MNKHKELELKICLNGIYLENYKRLTLLCQRRCHEVTEREFIIAAYILFNLVSGSQVSI